MLKRHRTTLLACIVLTGCALTPDRQRPPAPVAAAWPADTFAASADQPIADISWTDFYPDPRLQALIRQALDHNRELQASLARVDEARAAFRIQRAGELPQVDLEASADRNRSPADIARSDRGVITPRYDVALGVSAFELDFWGRLRNLSESARARYLANEANLRSFRLSLITQVAEAYLTTLEARERTALAHQTVASLEQSLVLVRARRDAGLAGDLDYRQAEGAWEAARAQLAALQRQGAEAEHLLELLTGGMPATLPAGHALAAQTIIPDLAPGMPAEVLLRRPDVQAAEQDLRAAQTDVAAARAALFPSISLTASAGSASRELSGLFQAGSQAWSLAPRLDLPVFDSDRRNAEVEAARARQRAALADYERALQTAFREIADLLSARTQLIVQLAHQRAGAAAQKARQQLAEARYRGGVSSYLEVLQAQRDAFVSEQEVVALQRELLAAHARLFQALGGGKELTDG